MPVGDRRSKPSPRFCAGGDARTARRRRATHLGGYPHGLGDAQARERRPLVGTARRRRAAGRTPTSGVVRLSAGTPAFSISRTDAFRCAARSGADRRSAFPKPSPRFNAVGDTRSRCPPGRGADQRSAFPKPSPRFNADRLYAVSRPSGPRCRPEVGVPQAVPAIQCRPAIRGLAALRAAVPTRGRRSPSRPRDSMQTGDS